MRFFYWLLRLLAPLIRKKRETPAGVLALEAAVAEAQAAAAEFGGTVTIDDAGRPTYHGPVMGTGLGVELADDLEAITLRLPEGMRFDQVQRERKRDRKGRRRGS